MWFGARWCARADAIFDVPGMHVLDVEMDHQQRLVLQLGMIFADIPDDGRYGPGCGRLSSGVREVDTWGCRRHHGWVGERSVATGRSPYGRWASGQAHGSAAVMLADSLVALATLHRTMVMICRCLPDR